MNPPWSAEDLKKKNYILREIPKTRLMDFALLCVNDKGEYVVLNDVRMAEIPLASLVYLLVYVSTYCVPIALWRQSKPFPLLYLGRAQIINQGSTKIIIFDLGGGLNSIIQLLLRLSSISQSVNHFILGHVASTTTTKKRIRPTTTPQMSPLSKRPMAQSKDRIMALLRRWVISLFKSIERPSS